MDHYENQDERLFAALSPLPEPPAGLARAILLRIGRRERRILAIKTVAAAGLFLASVWAIAAGYTDMVSAFARSGFLTFGSLLFSDFSAIASNLPDFLFSMAESFPAFAAATVVGGIAFALWSIGLLFNDVVLIGHHRRFMQS